MDELFGLSMNTIMVVLLCLLAVAVGSVVYVAVRNAVFFRIGLRNIPRRPAQTTLIILGTMLGTVIISAAFTTGDTVDYSTSDSAYTLMGHTDETVQTRSSSDNAFGSFVGLYIPGDEYRQFTDAMDEAKIDGVDGYTGVLFEEVPVINPNARLSEPAVSFAGVDTTGTLDAFPDFTSAATGKSLDLSSLGSDELFMNESAADELGAVPGDTVQVWVQGQPHDFTVADVVVDRVMTGANREEDANGMVTRLDTLHELFGTDQVSFVAISSDGGVRGTLGLTGQVEDGIQGVIQRSDLPLDLGGSKRDAVDFAETFANFVTTFFLILGLFSISAGILLIIMIFVMLAAERKSEMGMARAIGTKRGHLVQTFMSEGMAYNVLSAAVGAGLGVLVAFVMAYIMAAIFTSVPGFSITPHVTARTLIISYSLGVVLTFLTVTFSSWRVSNLNIVSAIRGTGDDRRSPERRRVSWRWVVISVPSLIVPPLGLYLLLRKGLAISWAWIISVGGTMLGALLFVAGLSSNSAFPFALGFSLMIAGAARAIALFRAPERPVYTVAGLFLLLLWGFSAGERLEWLFGKLEGDIEMFFLSGVAMVAAATFIIIYNSDVILHGVTKAGGIFGGLLPAVKTAVAYPLTNRFRTGMTLAMISLVIFSLSTMATMNLNYLKVFLSDSSRGGWDVVVLENPNNPIPDLRAALLAAGSSAPNDFRSVGRVSMAGGPTATEMRQDVQDEYKAYPIFGADASFIQNSRIPLESRAAGYESDEAVWQALLTQDDAMVIDYSLIESGFGSGFGGHVSGIDPTEDTFEPVTLELHSPATGVVRNVQVIGVIGQAASPTFLGMYLPDRTFRKVFGEPARSAHYVGLRDAGESKDIAKAIESTLLTAGVQADSLKEKVDEQTAMSRNFFYLMEGFMGLGLFVGIAAVGVIAFRTVVERRQQIGMLRAIGYKRSTVALSFLMETSFVTLMAVASGIVLSVWLSYFLFTSKSFPSEGNAFYIPWLELLFVALLTYLASLLMTFIPARQAASIPVAEALRYE